jgi:hypothetical protein
MERGRLQDLPANGKRSLKARGVIPFDFVLDELSDLHPLTKPMFGCAGVYVRGQIVLILRDRESSPRDNGIWIATSEEHHESLRQDFPAMRSIEIFGKGVTGWQVLGADQDDFEESVLRACAFVRGGDPRIGKTPKARGAKTAKKKTGASKRPKSKKSRR